MCVCAREKESERVVGFISAEDIINMKNEMFTNPGCMCL